MNTEVLSHGFWSYHWQSESQLTRTRYAQNVALSRSLVQFGCFVNLSKGDNGDITDNESLGCGMWQLPVRQFGHISHLVPLVEETAHRYAAVKLDGTSGETACVRMHNAVTQVCTVAQCRVFICNPSNSLPCTE